MTRDLSPSGLKELKTEYLLCQLVRNRVQKNRLFTPPSSGMEQSDNLSQSLDYRRAYHELCFTVESFLATFDRNISVVMFFLFQYFLLL